MFHENWMKMDRSCDHKIWSEPITIVSSHYVRGHKDIQNDNILSSFFLIDILSYITLTMFNKCSYVAIY